MEENKMRSDVKDINMVAACGLYCGECRVYLEGKCEGCSCNTKAEKWCKVKNCCKDNGYRSCAECKEFFNVNNCKKFNNFFSKLFALLFRSDRKWCIEEIRKSDYEKYVEKMYKNKNCNGKKCKKI
jgi:hypothetical protein